MLEYHSRWTDTNEKKEKQGKKKRKKKEEIMKDGGGGGEGTECFRCYGNRPLLLLLAEKAEAFLLVFLLVFLPLARAGLGREGDGCRERLGAAGHGSALVTGGDL